MFELNLETIIDLLTLHFIKLKSVTQVVRIFSETEEYQRKSHQKEREREKKKKLVQCGWFFYSFPRKIGVGVYYARRARQGCRTLNSEDKEGNLFPRESESRFIRNENDLRDMRGHCFRSPEPQLKNIPDNADAPKKSDTKIEIEKKKVEWSAKK